MISTNTSLYDIARLRDPKAGCICVGKSGVLLAVMLPAFAAVAALVNPVTEYQTEPLGMDEPRPRFGFTADAAVKERRIVVRGADGKVVWDSGFAAGDTRQIEYAGAQLCPFTRYSWRAEVRLQEGGTDSVESFFETGFLGGDWTNSKWITALSGQGGYRPLTRLSREIVVSKPVRSVRLYATALGVYEPFVNAERVTDDRYLPGWTTYTDHVPYEAFDVTSRFHEGTNVVSALVGDGWFSGCISRVAKPEGVFGNGCEWPRFRAEIRIVYADGSVETVGTDRSWSSFYLDPAALASDFYLGAEYDATWDDRGWKEPGIAAHRNRNSVIEDGFDTKIVWHEGARVRVQRELRAVKIVKRPGNIWQLDFGENVAGVERIHVKGRWPGAVVTIRHGESLDAEGDLWRGNLAFAKQTTTLTCGKTADLVYEPRHTSYGFRYLEVSGWPEEMTDDSITVKVLSSVGRATGSFSCSDPLLNRLFANVKRSQEANFIDVPTDCPQRCERFGWTGDAQIFAETAMMNYDVAAFFTKWNRDLQGDFDRLGSYADISPYPRVKGNGNDFQHAHPSSGWSDVGVVIPWMQYRKYADRRLLEYSYPRMLAYALSYDRPGAATLGDHLNLDDPTDKAFIVDAMRLRVFDIVAKAAAALGKDRDRLDLLRRSVVREKEFAERWFTADGELREKSQTAAAMVLEYGLAPDDGARAKTAAELVRRIHARGDHLSTGFLGTPVLLSALTKAGETELAYRLLRTTSSPSWLYAVTQGATTVWERWDSIQDGKFHPNWMNSLNHYAYGSVVAWFYDTICGIRDLTAENPSAAGFRRFLLAPIPGGGLDFAEATLDTAYGRIRSAWRVENGETVYEFTVPPNTAAEVRLPGRAPFTLVGPAVYSSRHQ